MIGSGLGFGACSMADRYGQDSLATFVEHFNLLTEAASLSIERGLTQEFSGTLDGVAAYSLEIPKLYPLFVRRGAYRHPESGKNSVPSMVSERVIIEENAFSNNRFLGLRSYADGSEIICGVEKLTNSVGRASVRARY